MIIKKQNDLRELVAKKLLGLVYRIENIGNGHLTASGENVFINNLSKYYKNDITFFDIGANIGEYTSLISQQRKNVIDRYHLFEPQKSCFDVLKNKFESNTNITLNNSALSDHAGKATIYKNNEGSGLTSLYKRNLDFYNYKMDIEEPIELDTAENYIKRNNIQKINLVKIDVEGNELNTLKGFGKYLNSDFIDFIQFEYGGADIDSHTNLIDLYSLLETNGFRICKIMKNNLEYRQYDPRYENFICQNYVAVSKNIFDSLITT